MAMKKHGFLFVVVVPLLAGSSESRAGEGFWKVLAQPNSRWELKETRPDDGRKPTTVRIETYDFREVGGAGVARLRWTYMSNGSAKDIGDSDSGRYTQVAVTAAGIYLLSAEMDDAAVAKVLKRKPSRSDPPRAYAGTSQNQGRFLTIEPAADGPTACMGALTNKESAKDPGVGEVCISAKTGVVFLGGGWAPAGRIFAQPGYEKRVLSSPPVPKPPLAPMRTLLVAGQTGIHEVDLDGKVLRTLSKTSAHHARYLAKRDGVLFQADDGDLRVVMLADASEKVLVKLPAKIKSCEKMPDYEKGHRFLLSELSPQEERDFVVDEGGEFACLTLADRNENMRNVEVDIFVDLKRRKATPYVVGCNDVPPNKLTCAGTDWFAFEPAPSNNARFPYGIDKGWLVKRKSAGKASRVVMLGQGDFEEEQPSPSGSWVAIRGNEDWGDYCHRDLFLLNRVDGTVWPVRKEMPRPLTVKELSELGKAKIETTDVVTETSLHWVPGSDVLLIDGESLVKPGAGMIELPGATVF